MLKRASPFFGHPLRICSGSHNLQVVLILSVWRRPVPPWMDILRSIDPSAKPPKISPIDHAFALLRTVQRFDISSAPLFDAVTQYLGNI